MTTKFDIEKLGSQVSQCANDISCLRTKASVLDSEYQRLQEDSGDSETNLVKIVAQVATILKIIAIKDEQNLNIEKQTAPQAVSSSIDKKREENTLQRIQNVVKDLSEVGNAAQSKVLQIQRLQGDTAELFSKTTQGNGQTLEIKTAVQTTSNVVRMRSNKMQQKMKECDEQIYHSECNRNASKADQYYYKKRTDTYDKAGQLFLFVPGVNLFASPYCYCRRCRNFSKSAKKYVEGNEWQSKISTFKTEHRSLEGEIAAIKEQATAVEKWEEECSSVIETLATLQQNLLELVDECQELSDTSFEVVRCARLLQSQVMEPMTQTQSIGYETNRRQALQSTRSMIRLLEKSRIEFGKREELRRTQALLEQGVSDDPEVAMGLLDDI